MIEFLSTIQSFIGNALAWLSSILWGLPMIILLLGTHIILTIRTGFVQRKIGTAILLTFKRDKNSTGDISQFGALMVALAATIGTGNIIGVGIAIAAGGPGAVFWCWLTGVLGIATKYSESLLSVKYRIKTESGKMLGGPMVVLDMVMHKHWLAVFFCIATALAAFGIGNMSQANSISTLMNDNFSVSPYITGLVMAFLVGLVMIGGVKWIASVCKVLVPFMALIYVIGCIFLLVYNIDYAWDAIKLIVVSAFAPKAVTGGFAGGGIMLAMRFGFARGLFSNESGMGSAPIIASAAKTKNAVRQALISASGTFWDTVIICALSGIVMVTSVLAYPDINFSNGAVLTSMAFGKLHVYGSGILTIALLTFVFSTLLGWSYYAERCLEYLWGSKIIKYYHVIWVVCVFIGAVAKLSLVWDFSDCANALMAIPNLIAVISLSGIVANETKKYLWQNRLDEVDEEMVS